MAVIALFQAKMPESSIDMRFTLASIKRATRAVYKQFQASFLTMINSQTFLICALALLVAVQVASCALGVVWAINIRDEMMHRFDVMQHAIENLATRMTAVESAVTHLAVRMTAVESAVTLLSARMDKVESAVTLLSARMDKVESAVTLLSARMDKLEARTDAIANLTLAIGDMDARIEAAVERSVKRHMDAMMSFFQSDAFIQNITQLVMESHQWKRLEAKIEELHNEVRGHTRIFAELGRVLALE